MQRSYFDDEEGEEGESQYSEEEGESQYTEGEGESQYSGEEGESQYSGEEGESQYSGEEGESQYSDEYDDEVSLVCASSPVRQCDGFSNCLLRLGGFVQR